MSGLSNKIKKKKYIIENFSEDEGENVDDQAFATEISSDIQELTEEIESEEIAEDAMEAELQEEQEADQREMDAEEDQNDLEAAQEEELVAEESEAMEDEQDAADALQDATEEADQNAIEDAEAAESSQFDDEQATADALEESSQEAIMDKEDADAAAAEAADIAAEEISRAESDSISDAMDSDSLVTLETDKMVPNLDIGDSAPDQTDDDGLSADDLKQINANANPIPEESDESDDDMYIRPVPVPPPKGQVLGDVDEQLSDLTIVDDTDSDNIFDQTGAAGLRAKAAADKLYALGGGAGGDVDAGGGGGGGGGGGIAGLIMRIPITIIRMIIDAVFTIIGAILEKPIRALDSFLQPIRDALYRLYLLLRELIMFVDQVIMFPLNLLYMYYEIFRASFALFGFPSALPRFNDGFGLTQPFDENTCNSIMGPELANLRATCNPNDQEKIAIGPLMIIFSTIANINPFRLADLFFSRPFRSQILMAIKVAFDLLFLVFRYIFIAIRIIEKLVLLTIDVIGQIIGLIENVVTIDNISEFILVLIYCAIIIGSLVGVNQLIKFYGIAKELIAGSILGQYLGVGEKGDEAPDAVVDEGAGSRVSRGELKAMATGKITAENTPATVRALAKISKDNYESINSITNKLKKLEALEKIHKK